MLIGDVSDPEGRIDSADPHGTFGALTRYCELALYEMAGYGLIEGCVGEYGRGERRKWCYPSLARPAWLAIWPFRDGEGRRRFDDFRFVRPGFVMEREGPALTGPKSLGAEPCAATAASCTLSSGCIICVQGMLGTQLEWIVKTSF